jgi:hypothetical protein
LDMVRCADGCTALEEKGDFAVDCQTRLDPGPATSLS